MSPRSKVVLTELASLVVCLASLGCLIRAIQTGWEGWAFGVLAGFVATHMLESPRKRFFNEMQASALGAAAERPSETLPWRNGGASS